VFAQRLDLSPGPHEIEIGSASAQVYVAKGEAAAKAPADWPVYQTHEERPGAWKDCATCHEVTTEEGRTLVGTPQEPGSCLKCHSTTDFAVTHFHPLEPIAACHMCHALHGSTRPSLLKAPTKELCAMCHA
jgi:predicted CXXCH cytochrome family protein